MEDNVIFKGKISLSLHIFVFNLNQPPDPRSYVPTNVHIFMDPRKLGPTQINDFTVCPLITFKQKLFQHKVQNQGHIVIDLGIT